MSRDRPFQRSKAPGIGTCRSRIGDVIWTVHSVDRWQDSIKDRNIDIRRIGVLEVEGTRASKVPKSRRDQDRPLEGHVAII